MTTTQLAAAYLSVLFGIGALTYAGLTSRAKLALFGFGILRLAGAVSARMDVTRHGRPICEKLARQLGETVNTAVLQAHYAVNVD